MRYITFNDDKVGRQQVEHLWQIVGQAPAARTRAEQRTVIRLMDKIEEMTVPVTGAVVSDGLEPRTLPSDGRPHILALEEPEWTIATQSLDPSKLNLSGFLARINESLLTRLEQAPTKHPASEAQAAASVEARPHAVAASA